MLKMIKGQSVAQRLLISILLVALVPVSFLTLHLYNSAWQDSWREIREKHQLIAENLSSPIAIYINDHRNMLALFADRLDFIDVQSKTEGEIEGVLSSALKKMNGFKSLILLDGAGNILGSVQSGVAKVQITTQMEKSLVREKCYLHTQKTGEWLLSGIKSSRLTGDPTRMLSYPVLAKPKVESYVILAELKIELIEELRRNVKFGIKGHSAIVDQNGRVIAHPNPDWMKKMRDLSHLSVVKLMMDGKTGVTTFYSPFIDQNMVAGYSSVPVYGWGIMVPQPESEVSAQVRNLMFSNIVWGVLGVIFAVILAIFLARWINNPINRLANSGLTLIKNNLKGDMGKPDENDPHEIKELTYVVRTLVSSLQASRKEVDALNNSLQSKVNDATKKLRESNAQLEISARSDYLTSLANRRYFEESLHKMVKRRRTDSDSLCVLLLDIDNFKDINDQYGHAAGDEVLTKVARLLDSMMRVGDLVARYAGDEFILSLHCEKDIAIQRAEQMRHNIESLNINWEQHSIPTTVSIGVYCFDENDVMDIDKVIQQADVAMYKAKKEGRNRVVSS